MRHPPQSPVGHHRNDPFATEAWLIARLDQISQSRQTAKQDRTIDAAGRWLIDLNSDAQNLQPQNLQPQNLRPQASSLDSDDRSPSVVAEPPFDLAETGIHRLSFSNGSAVQELVLRSSSLLCRCPDCAAPLTIRDWIGLADCWRCQTSIELTAEQIADIQTSRQPAATSAPISPSSESSQIELKRPKSQAPATENLFPQIQLNRSIDQREAELERLTQVSPLVSLIRGSWQMTPAWLVSLILHLIVILILALIVLGDRVAELERITLSTFFSPDRELGGEIRIAPSDFAIADDLPLAPQMQAADQERRDVLQQAQQDANQLVADPRPRVPLPDLDQVRQNITTRPDNLISFAARDPRVRAEIVEKAGGTTLTEAAVARGLRWLVSVQNKDGSWSLANYDQSQRPNNPGDAMGTSLALLPLLGAGQTHEYGIYKSQVAAGLAWLIANQTADGDLRAGLREDSGMYAHGQAAIVLCEALALTGDQRFFEPAQRAIEFIEKAQHRGGGWRYQPGEVGDTSVFGWQMMALQSARAPLTNLKVDEATLPLADYFLDQVAMPTGANRNKKLPVGATYAYMPGRPATPAMTAEALLCRMYLGWDKQDPRLTAGVRWLIDDHLPNENSKNLYYWYYGTQVMHHYGGQPWEIWNEKMRELLITNQRTSGRYVGSWNTDMCPWGSRGGRIYATSFACCILEVYYRHLPLFSEIQLKK